LKKLVATLFKIICDITSYAKLYGRMLRDIPSFFCFENKKPNEINDAIYPENCIELMYFNNSIKAKEENVIKMVFKVQISMK